MLCDVMWYDVIVVALLLLLLCVMRCGAMWCDAMRWSKIKTQTNKAQPSACTHARTLHSTPLHSTAHRHGDIQINQYKQAVPVQSHNLTLLSSLLFPVTNKQHYVSTWIYNIKLYYTRLFVKEEEFGGRLGALFFANNEHIVASFFDKEGF